MNLPTHVQRVLTLDPFDLFGNDSRPHGVDVREDADTLVVEAELPGYKKGEVEIVLDKSVLTITATKAATSEGKVGGDGRTDAAGEWLLRERRQGGYRRAFHLPRTADGASVSATLEDGVLTVTLAKREETKPRKITVS